MGPLGSRGQWQRFAEDGGYRIHLSSGDTKHMMELRASSAKLECSD